MFSASYLLVLTFFAAVALSVLFTPLVAALARRWGAVDVPERRSVTPAGSPSPPTADQSEADKMEREKKKEQIVIPPPASFQEGGQWGVAELRSRKWYPHPTPLLGGVAVYLAFALVLGSVAWWTRAPFEGRITPLELLAVFGAGALLLLGGALDDRFRLRPWGQFCFPLAACFLVAAAGIGISRITNPFGDVLTLAPWASVTFTVVWLLGTTYTTKLLDGLDGLVTGITAIGAALIAALSLTTRYYQPDVAVIALALAGAAAGFLVFNFHPARIFLGEGGSTLCGFLLGILAIISGGKVATALLVLGVPAVDAALVIGQRLVHRAPVFSGDRLHLHYRLLDFGLSHRSAVLILYALAAGFGATTLFLQASQKLLALGVLAAVTIALSVAGALRARV